MKFASSNLSYFGLFIHKVAILVMFAGRNRKLMTKTTSTSSPITTTTSTKVG